MKNAAIIIATRPDSKRLPNKAFLKVAGIPAIEHILHRLSDCYLPIILAIPDGCDDYNYLIQKYEKELDLRIFRGFGDSPLHRIHYAAGSLNPVPEYIVRITHDDILIDSETILEMLNGIDLHGYAISPTIVDGAGVEIIHQENLTHAVQVRDEPTEFVSYFVKNFPFVKQFQYKPRKEIERPYRLTMDYYEDWLVLDTVLKEVGPFAPLERVCEFLDDHPNLLNWNHLPEVTFYTCVHNGEKTIGQTMNSVLSQGGDFEYLVVDDFSTDETVLEISQFSRDKRVSLIKNTSNMGLAASSNVALKNAKGKWIVRVDADDILLPSYLAKIRSHMGKTEAGVIYPSYYETQYGEKLDRKKDQRDPRDHHHAGCAMMDRRLINEIQFSNHLRHWDSLDLYKRIMEKKNIDYFDDPIWIYVRHPDSLSAHMTKGRQDDLDRVTK